MTPPEIQRATILIVDDDPSMRASLGEFLGDLGHDVLEACDGIEGEALWRRERPELTLCDLRMPGGVSGLDLLRTIHSEDPEAAVVVVSGSADMRDAVQSLKLGALDYLVKPIFDLDVVEHAVRRALRHAALLESNRRYHEQLEEANAHLLARLDQIRDDEAAGRRLQFRLMPPPEEQLGELHCSRWILPSESLSGDFVDWFAIDEDRYGVYVVDVMGHGVSSAFVTILVHEWLATCLQTFREGRGDVITRPDAVLDGLNSYVLQRKAKPLTCFYAVIDHRRGVLTYANGGHYPFPILHDGEHTRMLEARGFAVGHFAFAEYTALEEPLPDDYTLTVLSDGILDAMPADDSSRTSLADREQRLVELVAEHGTSIGSLLTRIGLARQDRLSDDVTFLLVHGSRRGDASG